MFKKPCILPLAFLFFPIFAWPQEPPDYWVSRPYHDGLVIIGVSNRRLGGKGEIESARDDAAQKLVWYHGIKGTVRSVLADGHGPWGLEHSSKTALEPDSAANFEALRETLKFDPARDVFRTSGAVFVRFTCPAAGVEYLDYEAPVFVNGAPQWIHRPIREAGGGYITAVGFSGPRHYLKEAVIQSREDAAAALMVSLSVQTETIEKDSSHGAAASRIEERTGGKLMGFMVLEMWIDPKSKAVWTLAAARRGG